jgi:hypothetical protein
VLELLIENGKTDTGKDGTAAFTLTLDEAESATPAAAALGNEAKCCTQVCSALL